MLVELDWAWSKPGLRPHLRASAMGGRLFNTPSDKPPIPFTLSPGEDFVVLSWNTKGLCVYSELDRARMASEARRLAPGASKNAMVKGLL